MKNFVIMVLLISNYVLSQTPQVISVSPNFNEITPTMNPEISATFNVDMDSSTFDGLSFIVFGERSGYHSGDIDYIHITKTALFKSSALFSAGEQVTVLLSNQIRSTQGDALTGFSWIFRIPAGIAPANFSEPVEYGGGGDYMEIGDMNNDNYPDIVTSSGVIWINDGYGVFNQYWLIPDCVSYYPLVTDDFNRDGLMDVFFTGVDGLKIGIGDGEGNFSITTKPFWFYDLCSADLNGDGFADIAGISGVTYLPPDSTTLNWGIAFNDGTGNFIDTTMLRVGGGGSPARIITTDLDNDGDFDVVIASHPEVNPNGIFGLNGFITGKNDGFGNFNTFNLNYTDDIQFPYYLYASDFNNDSFNDVAVISSGGGVVELNNGDGTFSLDTADTRWYWPAELSSPITGSDLNGDNWIDIVISGYEWPPEWQIPYYAVNLNNNGYFPGFWNNDFNDTLPDGFIKATGIADLNMDGRSDIIHCSSWGTYITFNKDSVTDVKEHINPITNFSVSQNYPNPFNSNTKFEIEITEPQRVLISIFNLLGEEVRVLENKRYIKGRYKINWDGRDKSENNLPSGVYLIKVQADKQIQYLKSIILK